MAFSKEELKQLIELGVIDDKMLDLDEDMIRATKLRDSQAGQGISSGAGFVSGSALSGVGALVRQFKGAKEQKKIKAAREGLQGDQTRARTTFANALQQPQQGGLPPAQPQAMIPPTQATPVAPPQRPMMGGGPPQGMQPPQGQGPMLGDAQARYAEELRKRRGY